MRVRLAAVPLAIAALALATHARAQSEPGADDHLERGLRYYATQDYERAIEEFKTGYQIHPDRSLLYALAQAQRMKGDCKGAIASYKAFLRANPPAAQAELARGNLERCEESIKKQEAEAPSPPPASTAPPPTTPAAPATPSPAPPPEKTAESASPRGSAPFYTDVLGDVLAGVGVAALGVGVGTWFVARGHASDANDADRYDDHERELDAAKATLTVAIVIGAVGAAALSAGIIRYATRPRDGSGVALAGDVASGRIGLRLKGQF